MKFINSNRALLITLLISIAFLLGFYGEVLLNPNAYVFSSKGDGIKNYFTYMHHIKNDLSINHFNGMSYPFGDLHILSDGHTLLSSLLQFIPGSEKWAIGFLNLLILSSFPITACVLFKLLKSYNVRDFIAIAFAITTMMMAPQYTRMFGHISMAYSFFIPLIWYWIRNYNLFSQKKHTIYLFFFQLILYFTHPYMGVIGLFFILVHQSLIFLLDKSKRSKSFTLNTFVQSLLPLFLFQLYVIIIDDTANRATNKFNFGAWNLDLKAVFFSHHKPFESTFKSVFNYNQLEWESWCYLGLVNIAFLFLIFYRFVFIKRKLNKIRKSYFALVGIIGLIYSTGFFFNYGFGFILDAFPQIRQIRVLSRFSWIFYFTSGVFVVVYINKLFRKYLLQNKKQIAYGLIYFVVALSAWESYFYHNKATEEIVKYKNPFILENLSQKLQEEINNLRSSEYQALLAIPYFQVGGERSIHNIKDHDLFFNVLAITYHTSIPLINTCLSRSSNQKLGELSKILTESYDNQPVREKFINDGRKIALIKGKKELNHHEKRTISFCKELAFSDRIFNYNYKDGMKNNQESVLSFYKKNYHNFHHQAQLAFKNPEANVIFETYDFYGNNKEIVFRGNLARKSKYNNYTTVIDLKNRLQNKKYDVSFWYYSDMDTTSHIMLYVDEQQNGKPGKWTNLNDTKVNFKHSGKWSLVEFSIQPEYPEGSQKIMLKGYNKYFDPPIFFDQILIKEAGNDVYINYDGELFKNNFPVGNL